MTGISTSSNHKPIEHRTTKIQNAAFSPHLSQALRRSDNFLDREAEILEQRFGRRRRAETVDADHGAVEADVLAPVVGDAGFDRDALAARRRQHAVAIRLRLTIEQVRAWNRHDPRGNT